jgi:hypothetical protein
MITIFNQDRPIQPFAGLNGVLLQQKQLQIWHLHGTYKFTKWIN